MADCLRFHKLSIGGQLDYAFDCTPALETDELLDEANVAVTADSPSDLDLYSVSVPTEDVVNRGRKYKAGKVVIFRAKSVGSTTGDQLFTIDCYGNDGTILHYRCVVEIDTYVNVCP